MFGVGNKDWARSNIFLLFPICSLGDQNRSIATHRRLVKSDKCSE